MWSDARSMYLHRRHPGVMRVRTRTRARADARANKLVALVLSVRILRHALERVARLHPSRDVALPCRPDRCRFSCAHKPSESASVESARRQGRSAPKRCPYPPPAHTTAHVINRGGAQHRQPTPESRAACAPRPRWHPAPSMAYAQQREHRARHNTQRINSTLPRVAIWM